MENQCFGNQKKFAEMIGFAPQVISNIVSGRKSKPSFDVLNAVLSSFVDVNAEWLITGKGEMLKSEAKKEVVTPNNDKYVAMLEKNNALLEENKALLQAENERLKAEIQALKSSSPQSVRAIQPSQPTQPSTR
nr:helix-turn-helix transcriptional regulator [Capnocytophaga catalasegens]